MDELIDVHPCPSSIIKQSHVYGLKWSFMRKHLIKVVEQGNWKLYIWCDTLPFCAWHD
ncbi:hypothetical protein Lalb_Chr06g0169241 [Lupinus albus]|uniref:Uncharacterized protein n=1 Tax=Lupinus albus TaxID=3870 RepID=A0A6A4QF27_LUPAL|nr:hypothetical protein Lalb_Chr06g0169241 [Lupinus albus]